MRVIHKIENAPNTKAEATVYTREEIERWTAPPFQRSLTLGPRVLALVETIKRTETIPGILVLGVMRGCLYLIDGQHRVSAFLRTELPAVFATTRTIHFESVTEMAQEFVMTNSSLVRMRPDDVLRPLALSCPPLQRIIERSPFVVFGFSRKQKALKISASMVLRCWRASEPDVPRPSATPATEVVERMSLNEADDLARFLNMCRSAWGVDEANTRLWGQLNITILMWLFRRVVLTPPIRTARFSRMTDKEFEAGLCAAAASDSYMMWLAGRSLSEGNMPPCYGRLKAIFAARHLEDTGTRLLLPAPPWTGGH